MQVLFNRRKSDKQADNQTLIYVSLLGEFKVWDATDTPVNIQNKRAKAIFALLCLRPNQALERDFLADLLWPGRYQAQAKASLRQCLLALTNIFKENFPDLLNITRSEISLNANYIQSDLSVFATSINQQSIDKSLQLASQVKNQDLLTNIVIGPQYKTYIAELKQQFEKDIDNEIKHLTKQNYSSEYLTKLHALDKLWQLNQPPQPKLPIAILPFRLLPKDPALDYIGEGMVDEIIAMFGHTSELQITGRRSSFLMGTANKPITEIAQLLKVKYVVDGSIRLDGSEVKVNIQLIDGESGFEKWACQYEGSLDSIFLLQEKVAVNLARELETALQISLSVPKINHMTVSQKAYDLYMQGRALSKRIVGEGVLEKAIEVFEQALELDSCFAECWAALAEANAYITVFTPCLDKDPYIKRMAECADNALNINPKSGLALVMKGVYCWTQNDPCQALDLAYEAYQYEPNEPAVVSRLGSFLCYAGLSKQALPYIQAAVEQDPLDGRHSLHLNAVLLNLGAIDSAIEVAKKACMLGFPSIFLGYTLAVKGDHDSALVQYGQNRLLMNSIMAMPTGTKPMTEQQLEDYWDVASKGVCSGKEEDRQRYCAVLDMMHTTLPDKVDHAIVIPAIWIGYPEMLFKTIGEKITSSNMASLMYVWGDYKRTNAIKEHPEFLSFCQRIGLVKAWEKYAWPDVFAEPQNLSKRM